MAFDADDTSDNSLYIDMNHENTPSGQEEAADDLDRREGGTFRPEPIVVRLNEYMHRNGMTVRDLALTLDVPYPTLTAGMRGDRPFPASKDVRRKLARLLDVPGLQIAIWCNLLDVADFIVEKDFDKTVELAIKTMREDQSVAHTLPPNDADVEAWPRSAKTALVLLYQIYLRERDPHSIAIVPESELVSSKVDEGS